MNAPATAIGARWRNAAPGAAGLAVLAFVAVACALRLVFLTADPHYYGWFWHITDEGRWTMHARSLLQRGELIADGRSAHLVAAPLFQLTSYLAFAVMGVGHFAARVFPALCGAAVVLLVAATLWRRTPVPTLLLGLSVIAFQADYVVLSRVAVPEIVLILFELLIFLAIIFGPRRRGHLWLAGCLTAVAVGFKATSISLVFVFAVAAFAHRDPATHGMDLRQRLFDALRFVGGFLVTVLAVLTVTASAWIERLPGYWGDIHYAFTHLVEFNSIYGMLQVPFLDYMSPIYNLAALGVWLALLTGLAGLHRDTPPTQRRMLRVATAWTAAYALVMLVNRYSPGRYCIHILTPVAILIALGTAPLVNHRLEGVAARLASGSRPRVFFNLAVLAVPAAAMAAPLVVDTLGVLGFSAARFRFLLASLFLGWILAAALALALRNRPRPLACLALVPMAGAIGWFTVWIVATASPVFWPTGAWVSHSLAYAFWGLTACLGAGLIAAFAKTARLPEGWAPVTTGLVISAAWIVQLAPGFVSPTYTVVDASREIGRLFDTETVVVQNSAEGLFLDNNVPFHRLEGHLKRESLPERLVFAFSIPDAHLVKRHYDLIAAPTLHVSEQYRRRYTDIDSLLCFEGNCPNLFIFERRR